MTLNEFINTTRKELSNFKKEKQNVTKIKPYKEWLNSFKDHLEEKGYYEQNTSDPRKS